MKKLLVFAAVILTLYSIYAVKLQYEKSFAINVAKDYLAKKYEEEMIYRNVLKFNPLIEPGNFTVIFYPSSQPENIFSVEVNSWGKNKKEFLLEDCPDNGKGIIQSHDNYLLQKFNYEINNKLKEMSSSNLSLFAIYHNDARTYLIPNSLSENTDFAEAEKLIDYTIYADSESSSSEYMAESLCELFDQLKRNSFCPKEVILKLQAETENKYIHFDDWDSISYDDILGQIDHLY